MKMWKEVTGSKEPLTINITKYEDSFGLILELGEMSELKKQVCDYLGLDCESVAGLVQCYNIGGKGLLVNKSKFLHTTEEVKVKYEERGNKKYIIFCTCP